MDSILSESVLPLKYVAYSHCFRTEAGAAGTATRYVPPFVLIYSMKYGHFCALYQTKKISDLSITNSRNLLYYFSKFT